MKKDYKKLWNKLRKTIQDDVKICEEIIETSHNSRDYAEVLEYRGNLSSYEFLLNAMDELDGTEHHGIFSVKGQK